MHDLPLDHVVGVVSDVNTRLPDSPDSGPSIGRWPRGWHNPRRGHDLALPRYPRVAHERHPALVLPAVPPVVRDLDPNLPSPAWPPSTTWWRRKLYQPRSLSAAGGGLRHVARYLSIVGIYVRDGLLRLQQHAKDISIRLALGGGPAASCGWSWARA